MKTVEHRRDTLPKLTRERHHALEQLAARPDAEIDITDIPELADERWADAEHGRFYRPIKRQITARVDADVLAWLKADGRGYQTRLNTNLRGAMERDRKGRAG